MTKKQLKYIEKKIMPALMAHKNSWPFKKPVDPVKLGIPVSFDLYSFNLINFRYVLLLWIF